jgi:hypothetical protein
MMYAWCGVDKSLDAFLIGCTIEKVEQLQTNKTYMDKDFEPGSFLKKRDYIKKDNRDLALIAVLCIGVLAFFVLKLANII